MEWQYTDITQTSVFTINGDGTITSLSINDPIIVSFLANGGTISQVSLQDAQDQVCDLIDTLKFNILYAGFTYTDGNNYDSDSVSVANITATLSIINSGVTLPDGFTWRTQSNVNIPYNNTQFIIFATSIFGWGEDVYIASWEIKAAVNALTDVPSVIAYDITTGWPANLYQ
jgi:hypothetical protein